MAWSEDGVLQWSIQPTHAKLSTDADGLRTTLRVEFNVCREMLRRLLDDDQRPEAEAELYAAALDHGGATFTMAGAIVSREPVEVRRIADGLGGVCGAKAYVTQILATSAENREPADSIGEVFDALGLGDAALARAQQSGKTETFTEAVRHALAREGIEPGVPAVSVDAHRFAEAKIAAISEQYARMGMPIELAVQARAVEYLAQARQQELDSAQRAHRPPFYINFEGNIVQWVDPQGEKLAEDETDRWTKMMQARFAEPITMPPDWRRWTAKWEPDPHRHRAAGDTEPEHCRECDEPASEWQNGALCAPCYDRLEAEQLREAEQRERFRDLPAGRVVVVKSEPVLPGFVLYWGRADPLGDLVECDAEGVPLEGEA